MGADQRFMVEMLNEEDYKAKIAECARLRAALLHAQHLTEIVRMPNAEHVADAHNDAVRILRAALGPN